jgi:hypothetical protein
MINSLFLIDKEKSLIVASSNKGGI